MTRLAEANKIVEIPPIKATLVRPLKTTCRATADLTANRIAELPLYPVVQSKVTNIFSFPLVIECPHHARHFSPCLCGDKPCYVLRGGSLSKSPWVSDLRATSRTKASSLGSAYWRSEDHVAALAMLSCQLPFAWVNPLCGKSPKSVSSSYHVMNNRSRRSTDRCPW